MSAPRASSSPGHRRRVRILPWHPPGGSQRPRGRRDPAARLMRVVPLCRDPGMPRPGARCTWAAGGSFCSSRRSTPNRQACTLCAARARGPTGFTAGAADATAACAGTALNCASAAHRPSAQCAPPSTITTTAMLFSASTAGSRRDDKLYNYENPYWRNF